MQRLFLGKEGALATQTSINQSTSKATPTDSSKQSRTSSTVDEPVVIPSTPDSTPRLNRVNRTPGEDYRVVLRNFLFLFDLCVIKKLNKIISNRKLIFLI